MWIIYAFLSAISAALVAVFGKLGLKGIDSTLATTIRSVIMAIFLALVSIFMRKFNGFTFGMLSSRDWLLIALAGIAGALSWLFYFFALQNGLATSVVVIDRMSVIFLLILAALFLGEPLGWKSVIGGMLMVSGAIMIAFK